MSDEKREIERAIRDASSITDAARTLGASRRTLQNRMRRYQLPRGKAGRPRKRLRRRHVAASVLTVGAVAVVGALLFARKTTV